MRKIFPTILFLLFINLHVFPQAYFYGLDALGLRPKIDSLKKKLPALKEFNRIDCLNDLSESYLTFSRDTASMYAWQALQEAVKKMYVPGEAEAYRNLGRIECFKITDLPAGEKYLTKSLQLYLITHNDREIAWAWGALGVSKWVLSKFPEAMEAYNKAVPLFIKVRDTIDLANAYSYMSNTEREGGHYAKALEYVLKQKQLTGKEDSFNLARLYGDLGDDESARAYSSARAIFSNDEPWKYLGLAGSFIVKKQYDSAFYYFRLFTNYAKQIGAGPLSKLYVGLGQVHSALKHYDTALAYLNEARNISKKGSDNNQVMRVLIILSKTYKEKGDYNKAKNTAEELLKMAALTDAWQFIRDAHYILYELFDQLHKKDSAYFHLQQYTIIKDSIDINLTAQKLAFYKIKSQNEKAQARISLLNEEKKLQEHELKERTKQRKILLAGIIILLITGVVFYRNTTLKRKNEKSRLALAENELRMQKLESERRQAALQQHAADLEMQALRAQMNPHFIFNCLNAINGFILTNESETAADYLTKFSRLIRMVLKNSQKKIISLQEELETLNLYLHMESLRFKNNFTYIIKCDDDMDTLAVFIPPLLLQPFAENAIWHGLMNKEGKGELLINSSITNDTLCCTITDNGVGREKAALLKSKSIEKNKSMGMQITKSRIALLNTGSDDQSFFEITDLKDEAGNPSGTSVCLKIKINQSQETIPGEMIGKIIEQ